MIGSANSIRFSISGWILFVVMAVALPVLAPAQTTWHVDDDAPNDPGPGDTGISDPGEDGSTSHPYDAIQEAVDVSSDGDLVLVADGTYSGEGNKNIDYGGRAITVRSEDGPDGCIVDLGDQLRAFYFHSGEDQRAVVKGFTISKGVTLACGSTIYCNLSNPLITGNILTANDSFCSGGGISCHEASPIITGNTITGNSAVQGGGIDCTYFSFPVISNNILIDNSADEGGGIDCTDFSSPLIINNILAGNSADSGGGGIYCDAGSFPLIANNTIVDNVSLTGDGGGIFCRGSAAPDVTVINSILWNNTGADIYTDSGHNPVVTHCLVDGGWPGSGNIDADPLLLGNYRLALGSPCIDAGSAPASSICFDSAEGFICMDSLTTRTSMDPDIGIVDLGYHAPISGDPVSIRWDPRDAPLPPAAATPLITTVPSTGSDTCEIGILTSSGSAQNGRFGQALSLDAGTLLVGEPLGSLLGGHHEGRAWLFRREDDTWSLEAGLVAGDPDPEDTFGKSVSLSGDRAMIGAPFDDGLDVQAGAAYIFVRTGSVWDQETKLTASNGNYYDFFGHSVSISGDLAVVGSYWDDEAGDRTGAAFVHRRQGTAWPEEAKLTAPAAAYYDEFGYAVATDGNVVAVGARNEGYLGAVHVYRFDGSSWSEEAILAAGDGASGHFGSTLALEGDTLLVGAPYAAHGRGSVYAFQWDGAVWEEQSTLTAGNGDIRQQFGWSVALDGDMAVVGAHGADGAVRQTGAAYLFHRGPDGWNEASVMTALKGATGDALGVAVAAGGGHIALGADGDDRNGRHYAGSVFIFGTGSTCSTLDAELVCTPSAGTLPFNTLMSTEVTNTYDGSYRRYAMSLDVRLANGNSYSNWRSGTLTIDPAEHWTLSWSQPLPALGSLLGNNIFTLTGTDITPPPFNQPPHPPAGDTNSDVCTVTGITP